MSKLGGLGKLGLFSWLGWWIWLGKRSWGEFADSDRFMGGGLIGHQILALIADGQAAIEPLTDLDAGASITATLAIGGDRQRMTGKGDRVVAVDGALMLEAKDLLRLESRGPRSVGRARLAWRDRESGIEARQILLQQLIGVSRGGNSSLA